MSDYPEHDKLEKINELSQTLGEFLDLFLPEKGYVLAEYGKGDPWADWKADDSTWNLGHPSTLYPVTKSVSTLLAEFFGIDEKKLEAEKRQMLEALRG